MRASTLILSLTLSLALSACASKSSTRRRPVTSSPSLSQAYTRAAGQEPYSQEPYLQEPYSQAPYSQKPSSLSLDQTLELARSNSPEEAIITLDRHPLAFPLNAENLATLQQAQVHPDVLDYLQKRASIDWASLHADELQLEASSAQIADSGAGSRSGQESDFGIPVERPLSSAPSSVEYGSLASPRETRIVALGNDPSYYGQTYYGQTYYGQTYYGQTYYRSPTGTIIFGQTTYSNPACQPNSGQRVVIIGGSAPVIRPRVTGYVQIGAPVYQQRRSGRSAYRQSAPQSRYPTARVLPNQVSRQVSRQARSTQVIRQPSVSRQGFGRSIQPYRR